MLYPLNVLLLILPFDLAFNWTVIIHFPLAGIFTFILLRELGASVAGSVLAAVTFMLSGYLFSAHNVISTLFTVTWAPFAIFLFLRTLKSGSAVYSCLSGLTLAMMFLGGGIEAFFATLCLLIFLTFFPSVFDFGNGATVYAGLKKRLLLWAVMTAVFLLLGAVQLLPFLELARQSTRAGGLSFFEATTWSFNVKDFVQFFIPDPYGYGFTNDRYWANQSWLKTVYTGSIPFMLGVFFFRKNGKKALPFALLTLVFLSLAMGRNNLLYHALYAWAPFFGKIRYPVKFLFMVFLFISISAGMGFDALKKGLDAGEPSAKRIITVLLALATIAAAAFGLLNFFDAEVKRFLIGRGIDYPQYNHVRINVFNAKRALVFFMVFPALLYLSYNSKKVRACFPLAAAAILTIDLFFAHAGYYASMSSKEYHGNGLVMDFLEKDRGLYRVFTTPKTKNESITLPEGGGAAPFDEKWLKGLNLDKERLAGYNLEHRIFNIDGVEVMKRGDYSNVLTLMNSRKGPDSTNIPAMLNVKYVVSLPKIESGDFELKKVIGCAADVLDCTEDLKTMKVYEYRNFLPRFFVTDGWSVVKKPDELVATLLDKKFSPGRLAILEEEPWKVVSRGAPESTQERKSEVDVLRYRNNSIELGVKAAHQGILVASESYYPGWRVYVDGREQKLLKADYVLRAVALEAGAHTVKFVYDPLSFKVGAFVSAATLLTLLISGIYHARTRRGQEGRA
ncbi:MAG: YfhO family protein [Deltaproteobacteria bacterium]|nr:YfhO family protein [Deltaproteobacteria bacterium]